MDIEEAERVGGKEVGASGESKYAANNTQFSRIKLEKVQKAVGESESGETTSVY